MPSAVAHSHRPTTKVSHKGFKSKKATKGALRELSKGTTTRPSIIMEGLSS
jgi:pre-rRNA-processing protein TSR1